MALSSLRYPSHRWDTAVLREEVSRLRCENKELKDTIKRLQGNFTHFHICNHVDDACALCGLPVENEVHLRSR